MASITKRSSTRFVVDKRSGRETTVTVERCCARYRDETGKERARHFVKKASAQRRLDDGCDVVTVQHALGHSSASITLNVCSHLWPKAEDRARTAAPNLMAATADSADSVRTLTRF